MSPGHSPAWVLVRSKASFAMRDFDDGRVFYDRESGSICLLAPVAAFVIDRLHVRARGCSEDRLVRELMAEDDSLLLTTAEFDTVRGLIHDALGQLAAAGLVASRPAR